MLQRPGKHRHGSTREAPRRAMFVAAALAAVVATAYAGIEATPRTESTPVAAQSAQVDDGRAIYGAMCAECHDGSTDGAPRMAALSAMSARAVLASLESGRMREQATGLNDAGKLAVAEFVSGKTLVESRLPTAAFCGYTPGDETEIRWSGWGANLTGNGFRNAAQAGLTAADVPQLELQWAFAFPEQTETRVQPAVFGNQLIVGSQFGDVYSLDLENGCVLWEFAADAAVRGAITVGDGPGERGTVYVADFQTNVYALDAMNGALLWRVKTGQHARAAITGTSALHEGRLYVPISSMEVVAAMGPNYPCCTSSGELVALDAADGAQIWRHRVIREEAVEVARDDRDRPTLAPSGAPVWSSPTVDTERRLVYIGTGENYTRPASATSDSIIAIHLESGETAWSFQATADDAWNMSCGQRGARNCPDPQGPDLDFGMAPMLLTVDGEDILVAGQKAGVVFAFDPDDGELLWSRRLGRGGMLGGIHWGMAADAARVYAPISDRLTGLTREAARPGIYALDAASGQVIWEAPTPDVCDGRSGCFQANSAAPVAVPGVVFAGGLDGHIRAYDSADGTILWDYDTAREFDTVNGITGAGGALDGASPVVANGRLIVSSGYSLFSQMGGNMLLVFGPPDGS